MAETADAPYSQDFLRADAFTAAHEGSTLVVDSNGALTKYGINQKFHPNVDVRTLTAEQAQKIRHDEYWAPISGDLLASKDPKIAMMAYDTAILAGVDLAKKQILQAGGDPTKMYQDRVDFLKSIAAKDPKKAAYIDNWMSRTNDLAKASGITPGAKPEVLAPQEQPKSPLEPSPTENLQSGITAANETMKTPAETPQIAKPTPNVAPAEVIAPTRHEMYAKALEKIAQRGASSPNQASPVAQQQPYQEKSATPAQKAPNDEAA